MQNNNENIRYIDIKNYFYNSINTTIKEVENSFGKDKLDNLLKQYQAQDLSELVSIMFCAPDSKNNKINVNLQTHIKEMEKELYSAEFDYQLLKKENQDLQYINKNRGEELDNIKKLIVIHNEKRAELEEVYKSFNLILLNNNLNLGVELKKVIKKTPSKNPNNHGFPKI